ncbi:ABC transporter permease [Agromyces larvae]|uniref:ABC transporter permease n=1 Tax=Agromyces larvae TaxID=2929802 RepID=A0ABY4BZK9_9MICO|nr:ABC transporter permease [Agromyces larvae]UOE43622.1 ABC transporter permease [Agromyces larvae]
MTGEPARSPRRRLSALELLRTAVAGPRSRPLRTALSALGIAIGIASLTAITGIAASDRAQLLAELDRQGANLLVVQPGSDPQGEPVEIPATAPSMLERVDGVAAVGVVERIDAAAAVYRTSIVPAAQTGGLGVRAADLGLLDALDGVLAEGDWFDDASASLPTTVLGSTAAARLGAEIGQRVWIGGEWHVVIGVLEPLGLAAELDSMAFIGAEWADARWPADEVDPARLIDPDQTSRIESIFVRSMPGTVESVRPMLARTANPYSPHLAVSKLSELVGARAIADATLSSLAIGLAAIALLVGGIGIANTMVVAALERRGEIGLRRALGARSGQIASQFLTEAAILALIGGLAGLGIGALVVGGYAAVNRSIVVLPIEVVVGGPVAALVVGVVAGIYPALRSARLAPTEALRSV